MSNNPEPDEDRGRLIRRPSYPVALGLAYGSLLAVVIVGVCLVALLPHVEAVQQYGPNVVADFVGILITLTFVERFLAYQRNRAEAPLRAVALDRAWLRLNRLAHTLLVSYKASAVEGSPAPTDFDALMAAWQVEARHLDFRKPTGPEWRNRPWSELLAETAVDFETELHQIIDRYLAVLGTEFPATVETVIGNTVFVMIKQGPALAATHASLGVDRPVNLFVIAAIDDPAYDSLAEFASQIRAMHHAYRKIGGRPLSTIDSVFYGAEVKPTWGSGRIDE